MRNKGAIILISVLLLLISLYYLSFTFVVKRVENKADRFAQEQFAKINADVSEVEKIDMIESLTNQYTDSVKNTVVYTLLKKYTYMDCKERELNLGLDLKGGMNISVEISADEIILALSNNSLDTVLVSALNSAELQTKGQTGKNFIEIFGKEYQNLNPHDPSGLAKLFNTTANQDKINIKSSNAEVLKYVEDQYEAAISSAFDVLRKRIDQFGVVQPNIQKDVAVKGVFHIELPGIKDPERVENLLRQAANLEFWETYSVQDIYPRLQQVDAELIRLKELERPKEEKKELIVEDVVEEELLVDKTANEVISEEVIAENVIVDEELVDVSTEASKDAQEDEIIEKLHQGGLFEKLIPQIGQYQIYGPIVGFAKESDMPAINADLKRESVRRLLPKDLVLAWSFKEKEGAAKGYYELIALKRSKNGGAVLGGDVVTDARQVFGQTRATAEVSMTMNSSGATEWARITRENVDKALAIVLDGAVYSYPNVGSEIKGGVSSITGNFTLDEANDLANVLKSGKMPAPVHILSKEIVGPSLGKNAIDSGLNSFVIAFLLVLIYMVFYYSKAGLVADLALVGNLFLIFGVLASLGAALTLPGLAGIVLTIGMAVDANVLIYERIREELRVGKNLKTAIADGYSNAYSAIIDSNVTTLLIGIILLNFGVGPVLGFATTLIIGILCSLFTSIFLSRLCFSVMLNKNVNITFGNKFTKNAFQHLRFKFIDKRKVSYAISGVIILISLISLFTRGLNPGIDFSGGRNYVVKFNEVVDPEAVALELEDIYGERPEVKTFGSSNQIKVSTKYMIKEKDADSQADSLLYVGCKKFIPENISLDEFYAKYRQSSQKVGPTVADDIKSKAVIAIVLALIVMFLYLLIRFRKWQFSLGASVGLAHNVIIVMGIFSLFYSVMPFSMEIDQAFIAAILTVIGYSINDTVVVFDRIREDFGVYTKRTTKEVFNGAINSTISRTINTSLSTMLVLLTIFIFGGEVIRGFTFALLLGVAVGTYSSIFIASPIAYDLLTRKKNKK